MFQIIIAVEHLGAYEHRSLWSTAHHEDCSLGLLHSFVLVNFVIVFHLVAVKNLYQDILHTVSSKETLHS